jgi:hypothetical protein
MTRPARMRIGQLVVSGMTPAAARLAAAAFEGELARLAAQDARVAAPAASGPVRLSVSAGDPRQVGVAAARSLHARTRGSGP